MIIRSPWGSTRKEDILCSNMGIDAIVYGK